MKTASQVGKHFFCNFTQLPLSNSLFTVLFAMSFFFFASYMWLGICVEVDVDTITTLLPTPSISLYCFFPTHNSLFLTSDSACSKISARLKLVSVLLSSLLKLHIGHLEKRFPESII